MALALRAASKAEPGDWHSEDTPELDRTLCSQLLVVPAVLLPVVAAALTLWAPMRGASQPPEYSTRELDDIISIEESTPEVEVRLSVASPSDFLISTNLYGF